MQIHTLRAFALSHFDNVLQAVLFALLIVQAINIIIRHAGQVRRCLTNLQAFQDTIVIILAFTTVGTYVYRYIRLQVLVEELGRTKRNEYMNMEDVIVVEWWSHLTTGLWCSQNLIRLIDVWNFNPHVRVLYFAVLCAMQYILSCVVLSLIFLMSFSTIFYFIVGQYNFLYHHFALAYLQVFGMPFSGHSTLEFEYGSWPNMIPYYIWSFYGFTYRFLIVTMFSVVLVNSYHQARRRIQLMCWKYTLWLYIKERYLRKKILYDGARCLPKRAVRFAGIKSDSEEENVSEETTEEETSTDSEIRRYREKAEGNRADAQAEKQFKAKEEEKSGKEETNEDVLKAKEEKLQPA